MGDKAQAQGASCAPRASRSCPGTDGGASLDGAPAAADELGYPVLLKAAAGGGGKGMRLVASPDALEGAYATAAREAEAAFGDGVALPREGDRAGPPRRGAGARDGRGRADPRRAGVLDPAPPPEADRGVAVAGALGKGRRGRLLDQLLVAALDRALALAERQHRRAGLRHLDLDVTRSRAFSR